jgi:hypothetical protein
MDICNRLTNFIEKCLNTNTNTNTSTNTELDISRHNDLNLKLDSALDSALDLDLDPDCLCSKECENFCYCNEECSSLSSKSNLTLSSASTSTSTLSKNEKTLEESTNSLDLSNMAKKVDEIIDLIKECERDYVDACTSDDEFLLNSEAIFL